MVGEATNGDDALQLAVSLRPDIVLMDVRMPGLNSVVATQRLQSLIPSCRVIVLTTFEDDDYIFDALRAGAIGFLLKDAPSEKLFEAIRAGARGESFLQPSIAAKVVAEFARLAVIPNKSYLPLAESLLEREREVLRLIAVGASNREIATRLAIAEGTVKNHVTNILGKLGVTDRTQAALKAREMGLY